MIQAFFNFKTNDRYFNLEKMKDNIIQHIIGLQKKLNKNQGYFSIECYENYCHLAKDNSSKVIRFDTTSHQINTINPDQKNELKNLGFNKLKDNYTKRIILNSESDYFNTVKEIEFIFEKIYNVDENSDYNYDDQILTSGNKKQKISNTNSTDDKRMPTISKQKSLEKNIGKWIIIILIAGLGYFIFSDNNDKSKNDEHSVINSAWDNSVFQVEDFLKANLLKDPDSYQSIEWQPVLKIPNSTSIGVTHYIVVHKFRAKNSFAGYNVEQYMFELDNEGKVIDVRNMKNNEDVY